LLALLGQEGKAGRETAMKELVARGNGSARGQKQDIIPRLLPLLEDPTWSYRWDVVEILAQIKDPRAIPGLRERVVGDENQHVRWRALYSLSANDPEGRASREA